MKRHLPLRASLWLSDCTLWWGADDVVDYLSQYGVVSAGVENLPGLVHYGWLCPYHVEIEIKGEQIRLLGGKPNILRLAYTLRDDGWKFYLTKVGNTDYLIQDNNNVNRSYRYKGTIKSTTEFNNNLVKATNAYLEHVQRG